MFAGRLATALLTGSFGTLPHPLALEDDGAALPEADVEEAGEPALHPTRDTAVAPTVSATTMLRDLDQMLDK